MAYGFTYTLPTLVGTHTDMPIRLIEDDFPAASIDGSANAFANGGGDIIAYTDSTKATQLPIDVVSFVSSGSPEAYIWIKVPSVFTSATIYLEADSVQTSQPAVGSTYGRQAVWTGYHFVTHDGGVTESSAALTITTGGTPVSSTDQSGKPSESYSGNNVYREATISSWSANDDLTFGGWMKKVLTTNYGAMMFIGDSTASNNYYSLDIDNSGRVTFYDVSTNVLSNTATDDVWYLRVGRYTDSTTTRDITVDGVQENTSSTTSEVTAVDKVAIGAHRDSSPWSGNDVRHVGHAWYYNGLRPDAWLLVEHDNQSQSGTNWGTVGTWADSGGANPVPPLRRRIMMRNAA